MEMLLILIWGFVTLGFPLALIVATYIGSVRSVPSSRFIVGWGIGLGLHFVAVCLSFYPIFLIIYIGAHTNPVGTALTWPVRLVVLAIESFYIVLSLGLFSFVAGRSRPWPIPERRLL